MNATDVSQLFVDYLSHADSISAGVPDNDTLRKRSLADHRQPRMPFLVVDVALSQDARAFGKALFDVSFQLLAEPGDGSLSRPQLEAWLTAIKARIRQRAADDGPEYQVFANWVQANRTEAERTGWQIAQLKLLPSEDSFRADDDAFTLSSPALLTLFVD